MAITLYSFAFWRALAICARTNGLVPVSAACLCQHDGCHATLVARADNGRIEGTARTLPCPVEGPPGGDDEVG